MNLLRMGLGRKEKGSYYTWLQLRFSPSIPLLHPWPDPLPTLIYPCSSFNSNDADVACITIRLGKAEQKLSSSSYAGCSSYGGGVRETVTHCSQESTSFSMCPVQQWLGVGIQWPPPPHLQNSIQSCSTCCGASYIKHLRRNREILADDACSDAFAKHFIGEFVQSRTGL